MLAGVTRAVSGFSLAEVLAFAAFLEVGFAEAGVAGGLESCSGFLEALLPAGGAMLAAAAARVVRGIVRQLRGTFPTLERFTRGPWSEAEDNRRETQVMNGKCLMLDSLGSMNL